MIIFRAAPVIAGIVFTLMLVSFGMVIEKKDNKMNSINKVEDQIEEKIIPKEEEVEKIKTENEEIKVKEITKEVVTPVAEKPSDTTVNSNGDINVSDNNDVTIIKDNVYYNDQVKSNSIEPEIKNEPEEQTQITTNIKESMKKIEIISPLRGKGLDREYIASDKLESEANYIELGLIVYNDDGNITRDDEVTVETTDSEQDKVINGTGNVTSIYENGTKKTIYYYPFHYEFRSTGNHTITFKTNGMTESVTLEAK